MYQTISFCDFCDAFRASGREEQFSYDGKRLLFDWLEEYEDSAGQPIELDVIALCCEFAEDSTADIIDNFSLDVSDLDESDHAQFVADYLQENTCYLGMTEAGNHVYQAF